MCFVRKKISEGSLGEELSFIQSPLITVEYKIMTDNNDTRYEAIVNKSILQVSEN